MTTNKERGISKRVSESVYPADILADTEILSCSLVTRGAWLWTLLLMWRDKVFEITKTYDQWARIWGCSREDAAQCIGEMGGENVCAVTARPSGVTLKSRRLERQAIEREKAKNRKTKQRTKIRHFTVTDENPLSSISSSLSLISLSNDKDYIDALNDFIDHREEIGYPLTPKALERVLKDCIEWGSALAVEYINLSIKSGWRGVFPPKELGGKQSQKMHDAERFK